MRRIRVAQIGTSRYSHGNDIFKTMKNNPDIFEVVGYAFPENEREKFSDRIKCFNDVPEMTVEQILADKTIEAVTIETEEIYLTKYALMAARAGKHIHMEKPGGLSVEDFSELINTVKKNGTVFHTGYMYRYNPIIKSVIDRARSGDLGDIISVEAQMSGWRGEEHTSWLSSFKGGMMFYLGCHLVDLVLQIQGKPNRILPFNKPTRIYETDAEDFSFALFEYDKGVSFVKTTQAEKGGFLRRQLVVTGSRKKIEINPLEITVHYPLQYTEHREVSDDDWNSPGEKFRSENFDRYNEMIVSFGKMVAGEIKNPYSYDYELELYKTIIECCQ